MSAVIALLVGVIGGLVYANHDGNGFMNMGHNHSMMNDDQPANESSMTGSDAMFFQMMIPHHQQAIDTSNLAITTSKNVELVALAHVIADGQTKEIAQMKAWLTAAGYTTDVGDHMGHSMGGMLTDSELASLKAATGTNFDAQWLTGMIGHHQGALHMVQMIDGSRNAETKIFGSGIQSVQSAQITQMQALLKALK